MKRAVLKTLTACAAVLALTEGARGDSPLPPPSKVTVCSPAGIYCATADPSSRTVTVHPKDAPARVLWHVPGWSRVISVSDSGEHLVTCFDGMNLLPRDYEAGWPLVTFYERGSLVRRLSVEEVVGDPSNMRRTVSHYQWGRCVGFVGEFEYAVEVEGLGTVHYDARTGKVMERPSRRDRTIQVGVVDKKGSPRGDP